MSHCLSQLCTNQSLRHATRKENSYKRNGMRPLHSFNQKWVKENRCSNCWYIFRWSTILHTEGLPDFHLLSENLNALGFSLIEDKKEKIIRQVKQLVKEVYSGDFDFPNHFRFSTLVESRIDKDYDTVSAFFTGEEKTTVEKYRTDCRIKKIKEYLVYSDLTLSDLSFKFGFSKCSSFVSSI